MSAVMLALAACVLRDPPADSSSDAPAAALMPAAAAWNSAVGDQALCERFQSQLADADAKGSVPWAVLRARNAAEAIALLAGFKNRMYPADLRRVVSLEAKPDGNVRASWHDAPQAGSGMSAATPVSRPAVAVKPVAAPSLTAVPKASAAAAAPRDAARSAVSADGAAASKAGLRRQPIADKLLRALAKQSRSKVVDLSALAAGRKGAEDLHKSIANEETLADLQPAHAAYVHAQNVVSVLVEQLTALPEMRRFAKLIGEAENLYMPSGPPMSPLTASYVRCWALFDACVGLREEALGSVGIAVASTFGMHREVVRLIGLLQQSRMGIFVHQGVDHGALVLRELVTGRMVRAICPAGYLGRAGELWYARVLPPPFPGLGSEQVVFTTPYVLLHAKEIDWQAYFRRTLPDTAQEARVAACERHMKFGPSRSYWNEFVFEAYHDYRSDLVYRTGVPDIPESLPYSR